MTTPETPTPDEAQDGWVPAGSDYVSDRKFVDFPISDEVIKGILEYGFVTATPVQAATIEPGLAGRDLLVRAKTGTGKTAAFAIPTIERIEAGNRTPQAVMLAPTRELAMQIAEECDGFARYKDIHLAVLVGGVPIGPQEKALKDGVELIIGTPGRILDHMRRRNLDLSAAHMAVLDEADEMLSMGFYEDVTKILDATMDERQVLLFSATISADTKRVVDKYLRDPEDLRLSTDADNVDLIEHIVYETQPTTHKVRNLLYLLDVENPTSAIIFCNTREDAATVASFLDRQGLDVQLLSGELSQARRSKVMKRVKQGDVRFLVSTDVAARGIDISNLSHVINYSLPQDPSVYLHRTGRTGRIGKRGTAISLVGGSGIGTRKTLETKHGLTFDQREFPDEETCVRKRVDRQAKMIQKAMSTTVFEAYLPTVRALKERPDGDMLLAAALRTFFQWERQRRAAAGGDSSIQELLDMRAAKAERREAKGRGRGGPKGRRRDERPRREPRDHRERREADLGELDALLETDDAGEAKARPPKKKKRNRRKKKGSSDSAPAKSEGTAAGSPAAEIDDLDALLSLD